MVLSLTEPQCFFLVILAFAVIGFQRGWRRELVSLGCSLGAVLFLYLGGGKGLAQFLFLRLPVIARVASDTSGTATVNTGTSAAVPTVDVLITTIVTFIIVVGAGYLIGNKAFPSPKMPQERLLGILPAIVSGYFIMLYVANALTANNGTGKSGLLTFDVSTPSQSVVGNYVLIIFVIAVVVILASLIAAGAKKSSGGKKS